MTGAQQDVSAVGNGLPVDHRCGEVFVPGVPAPQGSMRAFVPKRRTPVPIAAPGPTRVIVTADNPETTPWRADVRVFVRKATGPVGIVIPEGPVALALEFVLKRRADEPKRTLRPHTRKPDLDKLARAVMDALTGLVYRDDAQVTELNLVKRTALIGEPTGVRITWRASREENCSVVPAVYP